MPQQTPYIDALQAANLGGVLRSELPLVHKILRRLPMKQIQKVVRADDVVYEHGGLAIRKMHSGSGNATNLFGQMVAEEDSEKTTLTDNSVRIEAGNLIVAGSDTTAVTLTYLVWSVLKQPQLQARLEEEVASLSENLTLVELEACPLLNSVIDETLRLYGAAPGALPREVPAQGTTINGYYIPGGVEVSTQAYTNHRDATVFQNPLRYVHCQLFAIPRSIYLTRWLRFDGLRFIDKSAMTTQQKAAYMPFGGGSRVCIGTHLAFMELRLGTALFFRHCRGARVSECMNDEMMEMDNRFLISPKSHCCYISL